LSKQNSDQKTVEVIDGWSLARSSLIQSIYISSLFVAAPKWVLRLDNGEHPFLYPMYVPYGLGMYCKYDINIRQSQLNNSAATKNFAFVIGILTGIVENFQK
jgi:hypothetical protein